MTEASITLPLSLFMQFPENVRMALLAKCLEQAATPNSPSPLTSENSDETGLAKLGVSEAKLFLNNCNSKTIAILHEIVNRHGDFMTSEVAAALGSEVNQLRGAWAGMTKRVRTVTRDPNAMLFKWFRKGADWRGVMASQTVTSMRTALSERA